MKKAAKKDEKKSIAVNDAVMVQIARMQQELHTYLAGVRTVLDVPNSWHLDLDQKAFVPTPEQVPAEVD